MKALVALAVSASAAAAGFSFASTPNGADVLVTRDSLSLPTGCSPREVAGTVQRFFAAFNRGDRKSLDGVFVQRDPTGHNPGRPDTPVRTAFQWYSTGERLIDYRRLLLAYFAERHRQHERMQLLSIAVGSRGYEAHITYVIRRDADDLPVGLGGNERIAFGKGAIDCRAQRIFLWTMGMDTARGQEYPNLRWECPVPEPWTPGRPAVACAGTLAPNAQEISADFVIQPPTVRLPPRCQAGAVSTRIVGMLRAFNLGGPQQFAASFDRDGEFHTYTASKGYRALRRGAIAGLVEARHQAGDGWTATLVAGPHGRDGPPGQAVYFLKLQVTLRGNTVATGGAKIAVDCSSGLLLRWVGPAVAAPA